MAVYYVSTSGSNLNSGLSEVLAWATIDKAMNTIVGGDTVYVKGDGNYNETATIDTAGTNTSPIRLVGYTDDISDGGMATISGQGVRANCIADSLAAVLVYYVFENFIFASGTGDGISLSVVNTFWKNCSIVSNGGDGFQGGRVMFENCKIEDNDLNGINIDSSSACCVGCRFYSNALDGIHHAGGAGTFCLAIFCEFFGNGNDAIEGGNANDVFTVMINCTVDGHAKNTGIGLNLNSSFRQMACVINNIFYDCTLGIDSPNQHSAAISRNNLMYNNTDNYSGFETFSGEVLANPNFNDESANDYRPKRSSPAIGSGYDANNLENF